MGVLTQYGHIVLFSVASEVLRGRRDLGKALTETANMGDAKPVYIYRQYVC